MYFSALSVSVLGVFMRERGGGDAPASLKASQGKQAIVSWTLPEP